MEMCRQELNNPRITTFINKSQCPKNLDLSDISTLSNPVSDLTHIQWIIVPLAFCVLINMSWIFPRLGEGPVVPDVAMVREAVMHVSEFLLLDILFDGIEWLRHTNLKENSWLSEVTKCNQVESTSILAFVQRGTSTTMLQMLLLLGEG